MQAREAERARESAQMAEAARAEEAAELRRQLADAQRTAEEALAAARQAEVDKVSHVAAEAAKAQSLQLQLSAAEEASERNAAKYRTELLHHSEDMQALSKAKEAEARAIAAHEQGKELLAEATAQHLAMKVSLEERQGMLSAQLAQQDELLANALRETTLLHAQLQAATAASFHGQQQERLPPKMPRHDGCVAEMWLRGSIAVESQASGSLRGQIGLARNLDGSQSEHVGPRLYLKLKKNIVGDDYVVERTGRGVEGRCTL
jgi:hypothetical protein